MNSSRKVFLRFLLGEKFLFSLPLRVVVRKEELSSLPQPINSLPAYASEVDDGLDGLMISFLPLEKKLKKLSFIDNYVLYAPRQYTHYYIDFGVGKEAYLQKFSAKSRSSLNRKVKKFQKLSGELEWRQYSKPEEIGGFFQLASQVSAKTYQEKLLNVGLPTTPEYRDRAIELARNNQVRAYILSSSRSPVAYLYCPAEDGILIYAYLGYDPAFAKYSPGGVLHWLAFQELFNGGDFSFFDFGQGEGDHKRQFSSHSKECADVYILKKSISNVFKVLLHAGWEFFFGFIADVLNSLGVKRWLKKYIRQRQQNGV